RQFAERAAINAPLQGSAADIIKKAMVNLDKALKQQKFAAKMILQVHDELLLEVPMDETEAIRNLTRQVMEQVIEISVPLRVNVEIGQSWGDVH
ncbi:MAG: DNA polymerase, partial [Burkholderiales bacterium]